jgi:hypothetical protein
MQGFPGILVRRGEDSIILAADEEKERLGREGWPHSMHAGRVLRQIAGRYFFGLLAMIWSLILL